MTIENQGHGPITADDVRFALGEVDPNSTNASTLRKLLGRGSLSTIQRHLDAIRFELAAPALQASGAAPEVPKELIQSIWSIAWTAAQAQTVGALAAAQALAAQQAEQLKVASADAEAALIEAEEAAEALIHQQKLKDEDMQLLAYARSEVQAQAETIKRLQEELDLQLQRSAQERESEKIRTNAVETTLRGELDRHVSQLADLRAMLGSRQ